MNSLNLLIIETIICLIMLIIMYKKYKIEGLYTYTIISLVLSFLMSLKKVSVYDYDVNLGIIPLVTTFTSFNIVIQKKGVEETKKFLLTVLSTTLISYFIFLLISYMNSSNINLFTNASYDNIFRDSLRIYFANIVTVLYGLLLNLNTPCLISMASLTINYLFLVWCTITFKGINVIYIAIILILVLISEAVLDNFGDLIKSIPLAIIDCAAIQVISLLYEYITNEEFSFLLLIVLFLSILFVFLYYTYNLFRGINNIVIKHKKLKKKNYKI